MADDATCGNISLLYTGALTSYTVVGALASQTPAMYAVAAFIGADEGPRSLPIYKYPVDLPAPTPGARNGRLISVPNDAFESGPSNSRSLCEGLNGGILSSTPVQQTQRHTPSFHTYTSQTCFLPNMVFPLEPTEGYVAMQGAGVATTVMVWGQGEDAAVDLDFAFYVSPIGPPFCPVGLFFVSLPMDHAYADLQSIANEIPEAVLVGLYNGSADWDCEDRDNGTYIGLHRASAQDPWSGANRSLTAIPGEGVIIAVETVTSWTPRRLCTAFGGGPPANIAPVADAGGPYDQSVCNGGVLGIWLDGTASFDPDMTGSLSYEWTTSCSGVIDSPTAPLTTVNFDCNPCQEDMCQVFLRVTDGGGAFADASSDVTTRRLPGCLTGENNSLRVTQYGGDPNLTFDWSSGPVAQSYLLLEHENRSQLIPSFITCGPGQTFARPEASSSVEYYRVEAFDAPCGPR